MAKSQEFIQTAVRVPEAWLDRLDRLAKKASTPGVEATRSDMFRSALYLGIAALESKAAVYQGLSELKGAKKVNRKNRGL